MDQTATIAIAPPAISMRTAAHTAVVAHGIEQVAEALSVSRRTVEREIERGNLRSFKLAGRVLVAATELDRYIAALTGTRAAS